ncbi:MAG TPA: DinB family protein [Bryobacteraceae bacterium]
MSALEPIIMEIDQESIATSRLLERIPEEHLSWRPHEKSMTLGQLALHIATIPGNIAAMLSGDSHQINPAAFANMPAATSRRQVMDALATSLTQAREFLSGLDAERAAATWQLMAGSQVIMALPRAGVVRTVMLNHWYHHRGQMTVYLRMLNVPLPAVYGRSADESAFGAPAKETSA